jgi:hypothetical protein
VRHAAPDHAAIAPELPLPETIAEHCHELGSRLGICRSRHAAEQRRHAHHLERIHGDVIAAKPLRLAASSPQYVVDGRMMRPSKMRLRSAISRYWSIVVIRPVTAPVRLADDRAHQVRHVLVGKRVDQDGVDHALHDGGGPDSQCQRAGRHYGEAEVVFQVPEAEANIAMEIVQICKHNLFPLPGLDVAPSLPEDTRRLIRPRKEAIQTFPGCARSLPGPVIWMSCFRPRVAMPRAVS